jgi:hypothetical protein
VAAVLFWFLTFFQQQETQDLPPTDTELAGYKELTFIDLNDPFHRALFRDVLDLYYPGRDQRNRALVDSLVRYHDLKFRQKVQAVTTTETLTRKKLNQLAGMFVKFILVYVLVMILTYYGVQTIGVWRFIKARQAVRPAASPPVRSSLVSRFLAQVFKRTGQAIAALVLFSPAYVIAYAFKTEVNTDTLFFMVLLATLSNGLLVTYAHKFYTFLVAESRKGYVDTAIVKNLKHSYAFNHPAGIPVKAILKLRKRFTGHVFAHIFRNARSQYLMTLKEQASFLITGLVIIEMALNIHGYLNYEMLRHILYQNYSIVVVIMLGIFLIVKLTEVFTDLLAFREARKYANI